MKKAYEYVGLAMSYGVSMAVAVAGGYYLGRWLDHRFGTTPWLEFVGVLLGIGGALKLVVDDVLRAPPNRPDRRGGAGA